MGAWVISCKVAFVPHRAGSEMQSSCYTVLRLQSSSLLRAWCATSVGQRYRHATQQTSSVDAWLMQIPLLLGLILVSAYCLFSRLVKLLATPARQRSLHQSYSDGVCGGPMVTANVIHRVFRLHYGNSLGTGFCSFAPFEEARRYTRPLGLRSYTG